MNKLLAYKFSITFIPNTIYSPFFTIWGCFPQLLQSNQVKRTPLDSINESIIWKLKPLVVSSIQIKIRFLIGLYEQCMKPQNQEARRKKNPFQHIQSGNSWFV